MQKRCKTLIIKYDTDIKIKSQLEKLDYKKKGA